MTQEPLSQEDINIITEVLTTLFERAGMQVEVQPEQSHTGNWVFNLVTEFPQSLIGKQGSILHAFQTIALAMVNKRFSPRRVQFTLDVDDYCRKREWFLRQAVKAAVEQAKFSGRPVKMDPLPHYERRIVHEYIQENYPDIQSESQGKDPYRFVVIKI